MTSPTGQDRKPGVLREFFGVIIPAVLIAVVFQTLLFQPFRIPSESMKPTLLVGDYLFVSKFAYGYSRHSIPFSPPLFPGRIFGREPRRGEVVVFRGTQDTSEDFIKRLVGLPGDRVQVRGGVLHINGEPVKRERIADFVDPDDGERVERWRETLPGGVTHTTLNLMQHGPLDDTPVYQVPSGHYFMMGDNRDDSSDSRVLSELGYIPAENLVGPAEILFFSNGHGAHGWEVWRWPWTLRWDRLFTWVR